MENQYPIALIGCSHGGGKEKQVRSKREDRYGTECFDLAPASPGEIVLKWSMEVALDSSKLEAPRAKVWNFKVTE